MGTVWSADFFAGREIPPRDVERAILDILARLVREMSHWDAASDLSRFNRAPAGTLVDLPPSFAKVLRCACDVAHATDGAFDPTLGVAVNAHGFGPPDGSRDGIHGWRNLTLDGAVARQPGGLQLDLSAIAKGFAVDEVSRTLDGLGLTSHLVEIGGELRGTGIKTDGQPWWAGIEIPHEDAEGFPDMLVALCGLSVATSGDYRRHRQKGETREAHTIDPRTGAPVRDAPASVTVIHEQCMLADAYSTALTVMGAERGMEFAERERIAALIVERDGKRFRYVVTPALREMLD